mmetsp:Transcript_22215/g.56024  ORF Transcript_22215/g.56024 Transcript_22215/m.56024 type:complete len:314 (+) Transcript_22215:1008-1949(+)
MRGRSFLLPAAPPPLVFFLDLLVVAPGASSSSSSSPDSADAASLFFFALPAAVLCLAPFFFASIAAARFSASASSSSASLSVSSSVISPMSNVRISATSLCVRPSRGPPVAFIPFIPFGGRGGNPASGEGASPETTAKLLSYSCCACSLAASEALFTWSSTIFTRVLCHGVETDRQKSAFGRTPSTTPSFADSTSIPKFAWMPIRQPGLAFPAVLFVFTSMSSLLFPIPAPAAVTRFFVKLFTDSTVDGFLCTAARCPFACVWRRTASAGDCVPAPPCRSCSSSHKACIRCRVSSDNRNNGTDRYQCSPDALS